MDLVQIENLGGDFKFTFAPNDFVFLEIVFCAFPHQYGCWTLKQLSRNCRGFLQKYGKYIQQLYAAQIYLLFVIPHSLDERRAEIRRSFHIPRQTNLELAKTDFLATVYIKTPARKSLADVVVSLPEAQETAHAWFLTSLSEIGSVTLEKARKNLSHLVINSQTPFDSTALAAFIATFENLGQITAKNV